MFRSRLLNEGWEFRQFHEELGFWQPNSPRHIFRSATVPGCVHRDLQDNNLIIDHNLGQAEMGCQWVGASDWEYRLNFEWQPSEHCPNRVLKFHGLDTLAEVFLNGESIGIFENMFISHECVVSQLLTPGENELRIVFRSPITEGLQRRTDYFRTENLPTATAPFDERAFIRKAQYMSGWDWGPRIVSCGIWQAVELIEFETRISSFRVHQEHFDDGRVRLYTETILEGKGEFFVCFNGNNEVTGELDTILDDPILWMPNGYGIPHLYDIEVRTSSGDFRHKRVGLKQVELVRQADHYGESFFFRWNGVDIWACGANWIPDDNLLPVSRDQYRAQLERCRDLNFNMLRVWGGGIYESEHFYDLCDELGILVWQDFPFACSYYPEDDSTLEQIRVEAHQSVQRIGDRACLALWCGNNENQQMFEQRWGGENAPAVYYGDKIYSGVLPEVLGALCPNVPYIPTSPTGEAPDGNSMDSNAGGYGDQHYWDVWHGRGDWRYYADSTARFSSEFGFASACSLKAWKDALGNLERDCRDEDVRWHDKTNKPFDIFSGIVHSHYPEDYDLEAWTYHSQLNQRDGLRFGIEHYRVSEFCKGSLIWQFNDCWVVQSWAVCDYLGILKPAAFELRRLYANRLFAIAEDENAHDLILVNDGASIWEAEIRITVFQIDSGKVSSREDLHLSVDAMSRATLSSFKLSDHTLNSTLIKIEDPRGESEPRWHVLSEPKDLVKSCFEIEANWDRDCLELMISGIVMDMLVWDAEDLTPLLPIGEIHLGAKPMTACNETIKLLLSRDTKRVILRHLQGRIELVRDSV